MGENKETDITANMDGDQKKAFLDIKKRQEQAPKFVGGEREFCKRMHDIRERRRLRLHGH